MITTHNYSECPQEFNCSASPGNVSFSLGRAPSYASLVSSSFSCLGSLLLVLTFIMLPEIRKGAQKIITLLSIADFFTAFGYFVAGINYLQHYSPLHAVATAGEGGSGCNTFGTVCKIQSFITTTTSLCSFFWTMLLAVYFHVVIVNKQTVVFGKKMFLFMNLISWGVPLVITVPLLATNHLGYSQLGTSNWCFIRDSQQDSINKWLLTVLVLVAGKFWEILSYFVVTVLYISISISIHRSRQKLKSGNSSAARITQDHVEYRLLSIPLVFLLLRLWGTVKFFYVLPYTHSRVQNCIPKSIHSVLVPLSIMQAIGDSGQGWSNAILYIFLSPTIRKWFICECIGGCCLRIDYLYQLCGIRGEMNGYSRFSEVDAIVNKNHVDRQEALNRSLSSVEDSHEREALNRISRAVDSKKGTLNRSSRSVVEKGALNKTKPGSQQQDHLYGAVVIVRETGRDRRSQKSLSANLKRKSENRASVRGELLDTASLNAAARLSVTDTSAT